MKLTHEYQIIDWYQRRWKAKGRRDPASFSCLLQDWLLSNIQFDRLSILHDQSKLLHEQTWQKS